MSVYSIDRVDGIIGARERSLPRFYYTFHVKQCVVEFRNELKLVGVKRSFYIVTGKIFQLVRQR